MKPSEKDRQPADKGDLEQTKPTKERLVRKPRKPHGQTASNHREDEEAEPVRKPRKPQGKTASKHREDKKAAITSWTSTENVTKQHTVMSLAEQSAFAWLDDRKRASPRIERHGDGPSAKKSHRLAPSKPDARHTAVTQPAVMSHYAPPPGGVVVPEGVSAGAMPRGIIKPPSDPNSFATLWDSSVGQSSSDSHTSQSPFTPQDSMNFTRSSRDGRKSVMKILFRRRAPAMPPVGLAPRVNRFSAAIALFGALSALAWALVLTSGTQTSRSNAKDLGGQLAISEVEPQPKRAAEANPPTRVLAALGKPDSLSRSIRAPQPSADETNDEATDDPVTTARSATVSTNASMRAGQDNAVAAIMVDSPGQLAIGELKPQPKGAAEASPSAPDLAALPQQAEDPDRLSRSIRAPAVADRSPDWSLRSPVREKVSERAIAMPRKKPSIASRAAADSKRVLEQISDEETSESPAPNNTGIDSFVVATVRIIDIQQQAEQQMAAAEEPAEQEAVRNQVLQEMVAVVEGEGLSVDEYNAIAEQLRGDPELGQTVQQRIQEDRGGPAITRQQRGSRPSMITSPASRCHPSSWSCWIRSRLTHLSSRVARP